MRWISVKSRVKWQGQMAREYIDRPLGGGATILGTKKHYFDILKGFFWAIKS